MEEQNNLGAVTFTQNADVISAVSGDNSTSNSPSLQKSLFIPKTVYGTTITGYGIDGSGITLSNAIKYVVFEADIIDIGFGAFRSESLESIGLPNSVTSIEEGTFASCSSLTSIEIPSRVTNIGYSAFNNCTNLISFTLEENSQLSSIGTSAFSGCRSLVSIKIPNSVTSIGWSTFSGCISLASIEIPSGVTSIGVDAFLGCTSLKYIRITSNLDSAYSLSGTWVRTDSAEMPSSWTTNVVTSIPATDSIGYYHQQSAWQSAS